MEADKNLLNIPIKDNKKYLKINNLVERDRNN
jgi:hypothetical protein